MTYRAPSLQPAQAPAVDTGLTPPPGLGRAATPLQFKAFLASQPSLPSLRPALGPWPDARPAPGHPWTRAAAAHTRTVRICCACPQPLSSGTGKMTAPLPPMSNETQVGRTLWLVLRPGRRPRWRRRLPRQAGSGRQPLRTVTRVTRSLLVSPTEPEVSRRGHRLVQGGRVDG